MAVDYHARFVTKSFSVLVLGLAVLSLLAVLAQGPRRSVPTPESAPFSVMEATITEMRAALEQRRVTSREIVMQYLARIALYKNRLHAAITVNVRVVEEADERDRERATGGGRGPLHGIPIALKDNIQTTDMPTTGGALAFDGFVSALRPLSEPSS